MLTAIIFAIVILSALWTTFDSRRNKIPFGNRDFSSAHPISWLAGCLVLWVVIFPSYLVRRAKTLKTRDPAGGSALASISGWLVYSVGFLCVLVAVLMAGGIIKVLDGRLTEAQLGKQLSAAIDEAWRKDLASANLHVRDSVLHRTSGNEYDGIVIADAAGDIKNYPVHVTYDGKTFSFDLTDKKLPSSGSSTTTNLAPDESHSPRQPVPSFGDKLKDLVAQNIASNWSLDPATAGLRLSDLTLHQESGNRYSGAATAEDKGQLKVFPFRVTYDAAYDNLSLQLDDELKRMSDEELRVLIRDTIEKKWRANPQSKNVHMRDMTLTHTNGNEYTGVVTAVVSGRTRNYRLTVTYDGNDWNYEVGDELPPSGNP